MLESQLAKALDVDILVARFALFRVEYSSIERAADLIYQDRDTDLISSHPFFGHSRAGYEGLDSVALDLESHGELSEVCFVCQESR